MTENTDNRDAMNALWRWLVQRCDGRSSTNSRSPSRVKPLPPSPKTGKRHHGASSFFELP